MKLIEISPYVRFAYNIAIRSNRPCIARDHRLFYITEGEGTIEIEGLRYNFSPGSVFLLQAGCKYHIVTPSLTNLISINFDFVSDNSSNSKPYPVILLDGTNNEVPVIEKTFFEDCPVLNKPIVSTGNAAILDILEKILFETASCQPFYNENVSALMKNLIVSIARAHALPAYSRSDSAIETVMNYIHKNYAQNVDNATLAEIVGYHPYYLNKLFLQANGVTLHKYVLNYRLAVSEQLLLSSTCSVDEIALKVGFAGALSFSSGFKKKNGITPTEFRKKYGAMI